MGYPQKRSERDGRRLLRLTARRILARHPQVSATDLESAGKALQPWISVYDDYLTSLPDEPVFSPDLRRLELCVRQLLAQDEGSVRYLLDDDGPSTSALRDYIVGHFGGAIADGRTWAGSTMAPFRADAAGLVERHPPVSAEALSEAAAEVEPSLDEWVPEQIESQLQGFVFAMLLALLSAGAVRGGVWLRANGMAVVTRNGAEVSRARSLFRALVAWSPIAIAVGIRALPHEVVSHQTVAWAGCLVLIAGGVWAVVTPSRGLQDRIAGTWLVPR